MFWKFIGVIVATTLGAGTLLADEIEGVFKKFEDGKVTIESDGKALTYKIDPKAKVKIPKINSLKADGTIKTTEEREVDLTKILESAKQGRYIALSLEKEIVTGARTWRISKSKP